MTAGCPNMNATAAHRALDLLCSTLPEVAEQSGISLDTLRSYRLRRRTPSPETLEALAKLMRKRASELERFAAQLTQQKRRK